MAGVGAGVGLGVGAGVGVGVGDALESDPPPPPQAASISELASVIEMTLSLNLESKDYFIDGFIKEYGSIDEIDTG